MAVIVVNTFGAMLLVLASKMPLAVLILNVPVMVAVNHHHMLETTSYYCESAYQGTCYVIDTFFPDDPLWDGQQCDNNEGTCCTGANTLPWFSVDLPDSTSDDIEVRICHDQDTTDEDSPIQLLELYVQ